ncbi:hypothetical protein NBRC10512_005607 [Rhodotorula toruloides]|uniref:RHTO0S15e01574g1_1 n=2 Tax=Rhodotorula toruloides TaxID=5286 RepID=A0A061BEG0_RHOTO|nr:uncharacterized protein RHTO_03236 [Rhodotorula toruloides NP11]EMS25507.1 hypothetical protein RHTO_03236 [Rhodotorula toruloides NP11]CDR47757.1 RHTO0S15e01574g1_1 [Rhodotorula toruloides]
MSKSAHVSTSTAPAFPRVGDTFSSLNEFKLACHRAALAAGIEVKIPAGSTTSAILRCRLCDECRADRIGLGAPCSFRLYASATAGTKGAVKVSTSYLSHSCPETVRRARDRAGESRAWTLGKIEELEEAIAEGKKLPSKTWWGRPGVPVKPNGGSKDRDSEGSEAEESDEEDDTDEDSCDEDGESEEDAEEDDDSETQGASFASKAARSGKAGKSRSVAYPSAAAVSKEVLKLVKTGPVAFPSHQTFSNARQLLVHLYAFAQVRGFTIHRKSDASDKQHLRLICAKGHHRYAQTKQGKCKVCIIADQDQKGDWRITSSELVHNHEIDEVAVDEQASPRLSSRKGSSIASKRLKREADKPPVQHAALVPASTPFIPTPLHVEDVTAFLYSIFPAVPAHELQLVVDFLAHVGISTLEDLAALLALETATIQHVVNAVQLPSLSPLEQASMRAAFHRCLETIRQQAKADLRM